MSEDNEAPSGESGWATYEPRDEIPEADPPSPSPPPHERQVAPTRTNVSRTSGARVAVLVIVITGILLGVGATAIVFARDQPTEVETRADVPNPPGSTAPTREEDKKPKVLSVEGFADLVAAIEASTGETLAFRTVLYPTYASMDVPVDGNSQRQTRLFWDGELNDYDYRGTSQNRRVNLSEIDAKLFARLVRRASARVDDPTSTYVIIEGANLATGMAGRILAYANNEFSEGAYVHADLDGKVVRVYTY